MIKKKIKNTKLFYTFYKSKLYKIFVIIKYRNKLSKNIRKKISKLKLFYLYKILFPFIYNKNSKKTIDEKKVIFLEMRYNEISNPFHLIFNELNNNYDFDLKVHYLYKNNSSKKLKFNNTKDFIKDYATAKYVFLSEASREVSCVKKRTETKVIQLWHGCGAFKKFGMSTANLIFGAGKNIQLKYPFYKNFDLVQVSSKEVIWAYKKAMNIKEDNIITPIGVSRTDIFFDENFKEKSQKKFNKLFPNSENKKIILYAPTFRGRVINGKIKDCFDVELFNKELGNEYVLVMKYHPLILNRPQIDNTNSTFAKDFTNTMSIEELLCISDICISDYSSLIFEYSLFEKPLIFYAYDIDEYNDWRGFYYNYEEMTPGPIYTTNEEMIDYIKNLKTRFNKQEVIDFKEKFMSACDGKSTERVLDYTFGKALLENKKA